MKYKWELLPFLCHGSNIPDQNSKLVLCSKKNPCQNTTVKKMDGKNYYCPKNLDGKTTTIQECWLPLLRSASGDSGMNKILVKKASVTGKFVRINAFGLLEYLSTCKVDVALMHTALSLIWQKINSSTILQFENAFQSSVTSLLGTLFLKLLSLIPYNFLEKLTVMINFCQEN